MSLAFDIAVRYLRRPGGRLVTAGGITAILGLVIGVMALVISMALMTGYRQDLESKILGGGAELFLYGSTPEDSHIIGTIESVPGVKWASRVVYQQGLVSSEAHTTGEQILIKGIDSRLAETSPMIDRIVGVTGLFERDGEPAIALGNYLATKLGVGPGDAVVITVPTRNAGSFLPRTRTFLISNVFTTGFFEFDSRWIFLSSVAAESLTGDSASFVIEIKVADPTRVAEVATAVDGATGTRYSVSDWRNANQQLFSLLKIQQLGLFIIIGLIVFVSTFNIVSTLIMTTHEKRKEIGILRSMGSEVYLIRRIFIWYGTLVGLAGTAIGLALGVVVCTVITRFELVSFGPEIAEVYFVSSIPFIVRVRDLAAIAGFALLVSWLATLIPSRRAARLDPVQALRHE